MRERHDFIASLLESGAPGYAGAAAELLLERRPEIAERFGSGAFASWKRHLTQRLGELAGALLVGDPDLFAGEAAWSRLSFEAREVPAEDLRASLECLRDTLEAELPAASREHPRRYLERGIAALAEDPQGVAQPTAADPSNERLVLSYLEAALSGDRRRAIDTILAAVGGGLAIRDAYTEVLTEAQRRVGAMWHEHRVSIPQEHFVTATTATVMTLLSQRAERRPAHGKSVVVSVTPGNAHELGARVLADFLDLDGWRVVHLGGALPPSDLALGVDVFEADLLALSIALSTQVRGAAQAIAEVRALRPEIKILVGGALLVRAPEVGQDLGADAGAVGLDEALAEARRLVGLA